MRSDACSGEARDVERAYQAAFRVGVGSLVALILVGVLSSLWSSHRLPGLRPLNALMNNGEPAEVFRELCMSTRFSANAEMTKQMLELARGAKDIEASISGTRHLIEIGAAWDAATFNRLAALLLTRAGALESIPDSSVPYQDLEDMREALDWSGRAARLEPNNAQSHLYQGIAHAGLGERDQAAAQLEEALRLDQNLGAARRVLQSLGVGAGGQ